MTSPMIPEVILDLFQNEINRIVKIAIKKICDEYDIDFEEATKIADIKLDLTLDNLHISKKQNPKILIKERCQARMLRNIGIQQCSRSKCDDTEFCKLHFKSFKNGTLKYGKITDPIPIDLDDYFLNMKNKRNIY
jgi:flagellar basal body P-ring protein FlgI